MITTSFEKAVSNPFDVCVVGSGPVGLAVALELERRGRRVLMLESGGNRESAAGVDHSDHDLVDSTHHHPPKTTVARQFGGTSNLWGGRCTPYMPLDLERREWIEGAEWPISYGEIASYHSAVFAHLDAGEAVIRAPLPQTLPPEGDFVADTIERFSNEYRTHKHHEKTLRQSTRLTVMLGALVTRLTFADAGNITGLDLLLGNGTRPHLAAEQVVVAGGGHESTRLLLIAQSEKSARFGGPTGPLGRNYMTHLNGTIADIVFSSVAVERAYDFYVDEHGSYVRRRIVPSDAVQRREKLNAICFWPVVPDAADAQHGSGLISLSYLALSIPPLGRMLVAEPLRRKHVGEKPNQIGKHLWNVIREAPSAALFVPKFLWRRKYSRYRLPGFFVRNRMRRYGLEFHGEQSPAWNSRVTLSNRTDAAGMRLLCIDYRIARRDAESIVRTHDLLEKWLRETGLGALEHRYPPEARVDAVLAETFHGTHQIGTIRMGDSPDIGVVDGNLAVFGSPGLFVASTAVLPTSGYGSPTLTAAALGMRLAHHLDDKLART